MIFNVGQSLQELIILASVTDKVVDLNGKNAWINEDLILSGGVSVIGNGGEIKYTGKNKSVSIKVKGKSNALRDLTIQTFAFGDGNRGIIELIDTDDTIIQDVKILGDNPSKAIMCKTRMSNTWIYDVTVSGNIGWGIYINDAVSEQYPEYRMVDGIDYQNSPIGEILYINNFTFGHENLTRAGDGIEINCPDWGFKHITINRPIINKTNITSSNGIGLGFARCYDVTINDPYVSNTAHDGIHFEKGSYYRVNNPFIVNCNRAFGLGHINDLKVVNGYIVDCPKWVISYSNRVGEQYPTSFQVSFDSVRFDGCSDTGFVLANAENCKFKNIEIKNYNGNSKFVFKLYKENKNLKAVHNSEFTNINIINNKEGVIPDCLISLEDGCSNNVIHSLNYEGFEEPLGVQINGNKILA